MAVLRKAKKGGAEKEVVRARSGSWPSHPINWDLVGGRSFPRRSA